jgi:hypothetical protein
MATNSKAPDYKKLVFKLNETTKYYDRVECPPGFEKIPPELKIEETRRPDIIQSKTVIHGRIREGKYLFFTGIIQIKQSAWYFGDHYEFTNGKKKNSFILFHFTNGNTGFETYYFNHYKLYPRSRGIFIQNFIKTL